MSIAHIARAYAEPRTVSALKLVRVAAGLSQDGLADRAELTRSTISRLENGREQPQKRTIRALTGVLGYPASVLFPDDDDVEPPNDVETAANGLDETQRGGDAHGSG